MADQQGDQSPPPTLTVDQLAGKAVLLADPIRKGLFGCPILVLRFVTPGSVTGALPAKARDCLHLG